MTKQEEIKERAQRLWCQHCKALQKTNDTVVECWYNPLDEDKKDAFCAANQDAIDGLFKDMDSQGVVIKVNCRNCQDGYIIFRTNKKRCSICKGKGYVAVQPLIKETP